MTEDALTPKLWRVEVEKQLWAVYYVEADSRDQALALTTDIPTLTRSRSPLMAAGTRRP